MKKPILTIALVLVAVAIVGACVFVFAERRATRMLDATLQSRDTRIMFEGALGQALFSGRVPAQGSVIKGTNLNALLTPSKNSRNPGLIAAYRQNPEQFRHYAKLFETAQNAFTLGHDIQAAGGKYRLPVNSSDLRVPSAEKVDSWGHPYCISRVGRSVAVVSGGPQASSFSCSVQHTSPREIAEANKPIFETQLGEVVVLLKPGAPSTPEPSR